MSEPATADLDLTLEETICCARVRDVSLAATEIRTTQPAMRARKAACLGLTMICLAMRPRTRKTLPTAAVFIAVNSVPARFAGSLPSQDRLR
jgi:hypothetical protein